MPLSVLVEEPEVHGWVALIEVPCLPGNCVPGCRRIEQNECPGSVRTLTERVLSFMDHYEHSSAK